MAFTIGRSCQLPASVSSPVMPVIISSVVPAVVILVPVISSVPALPAIVAAAMAAVITVIMLPRHVSWSFPLPFVSLSAIGPVPVIMLVIALPPVVRVRPVSITSLCEGLIAYCSYAEQGDQHGH